MSPKQSTDECVRIQSKTSWAMLRRMKQGAATSVVTSARPAAAPPREVARELRALLAAGCRVVPAGTARARPDQLLALYPPRYAVQLFDARFWLAELRDDENFRFFVA